MAFVSDFVKTISPLTGRWTQPPPRWAVRTLELAARAWPLVIVVVGLLLYLPLLDARPLRFEEGRRALQAVEILDGGSWWQLKVLGEHYVNKPPFTPWLMSIAALLSGVLDEAAIRLPGVLFTLVGALSAGAAAATLAPGDRKVAGLAGGLGFLCMIQILLKARVGETDVTVTALCGLAFLIWIQGRWAGTMGPARLVGIAACLACAALTKGPIPVAFPAMAMLVVPMLQRRWREAAVMAAVILASFIPLGYWAWVNLASTNPAHWASEMRLSSSGLPTDMTSLLYLNALPLALVYLLLSLPAAVAMGFARASLPRGRRWPVDALLLCAVPMLIVTTVPPDGSARYSMPAAWPVAVLAGIWISMKWRERSIASAIVFASLAFAVVFQIVQVGFIEGMTSGQKAVRARAEQFSGALAALPRGALPLLWTSSSFDHNLLVYAGRRLFLIGQDELDCRTESDFMIVNKIDQGIMEHASSWVRPAPLSDWGLLYSRDPAAPLKDCVPALQR